eukprot:COSAG04_NODE_5770_length_1497_cov_1.954936_1_plen_170_part_10
MMAACARPGAPPVSLAPPAVVKRVERRASAAEATEATVAQRQAYVGVSGDKGKRRWTAGIWHQGRTHHLGFFAEEEVAARAYDDAARRLRGEQAHGRRSGWWLNFPTEAEAAATPAAEEESAEESAGESAVAAPYQEQQKDRDETNDRTGVDVIDCSTMMDTEEEEEEEE